MKKTNRVSLSGFKELRKKEGKCTQFAENLIFIESVYPSAEGSIGAKLNGTSNYFLYPSASRRRVLENWKKGTKQNGDTISYIDNQYMNNLQLNAVTTVISSAPPAVATEEAEAEAEAENVYQEHNSKVGTNTNSSTQSSDQNSTAYTTEAVTSPPISPANSDTKRPTTTAAYVKPSKTSTDKKNFTSVGNHPYSFHNEYPVVPTTQITVKPQESSAHTVKQSSSTATNEQCQIAIAAGL
jgi:hypothetical protein